MREQDEVVSINTMYHSDNIYWHLVELMFESLLWKMCPKAPQQPNFKWCPGMPVALAWIRNGVAAGPEQRPALMGTAPEILKSVLGPSLQHIQVLEHRKVMKLEKSLKPTSYERT